MQWNGQIRSANERAALANARMKGLAAATNLNNPEGIIVMETGKFLLVYRRQVNQVNNCLVFLRKQENLKAGKIIPYLRGGVVLKRWSALFLFIKITGYAKFSYGIFYAPTTGGACPKRGGQLQIKMAKRVAERELTQENWDQEDEEEEVVKRFKLKNCYAYFSFTWN